MNLKIKQPVLLIRADANAQIGTGHVMRCLALAQAWQEKGGIVHLLAAPLPEALERRVEAADVTVSTARFAAGSAADAGETLAIAWELEASWIIGDSYQLDEAWQEAITSAGLRLLVLDDYVHAEGYSAQIVLNPNAGAYVGMYAGKADRSRLLLGARFALLRREFLDAPRPELLVSSSVRRVLVTMGGADTLNLAVRVVSFLANHTAFDGEVEVLTGTARGVEALAEDLKFAHDAPFRLKVLQVGEEMPAHIAHSDLTFAAAGSTTWELAYLGAPSILTVVAENQRASAQWCGQHGIAVYAGEPDDGWEERLKAAWHRLTDPAVRLDMARKGRATIDGQGTRRVIEALNELA